VNWNPETDVTTTGGDVIARISDVTEALKMSVSSSGGSSSYDVTRCVSHPLKPAKKYRSEADADKEIVRCKRKLDFIADDVDAESPEPGRRRAGNSARRPTASVARRNERERKRVSLINRTFEILRDQLPASLWGHRNLAKVSKVETLRAAIGYIRTLEELLASDDPDAGGVEDAGLMEMLNSAERLASLAGDDDVEQIHPSTSTHSAFYAADTTAASACEHLEQSTAHTDVDLASATRRLSRLSAPVQRAITQTPLYNSVSTADFPVPQPLERNDDDSLLLLDINSNNLHHTSSSSSSLKPADDDVIRQLVGCNFVFDSNIFSPIVSS